MKNFWLKKKYFQKWIQMRNKEEILLNLKMKRQKKLKELKEKFIKNIKNIDFILNNILNERKQEIFNLLKTLNLFYCIETMYNRIQMNIWKKNFINNLKNLKESKDNNNINNEDKPIIKIKLVLQKYVKKKNDNDNIDDEVQDNTKDKINNKDKDKSKDKDNDIYSDKDKDNYSDKDKDNYSDIEKDNYSDKDNYKNNVKKKNKDNDKENDFYSDKDNYSNNDNNDNYSNGYNDKDNDSNNDNNDNYSDGYNDNDNDNDNDSNNDNNDNYSDGYNEKDKDNDKNEDILRKHFGYWINLVNMKSILYLLINTLKLKKKKKEYNVLIIKDKIRTALKKKNDELNLNYKKKKDLLIIIINIKKKCDNNIIKKYFNKWKSALPEKNIIQSNSNDNIKKTNNNTKNNNTNVNTNTNTNANTNTNTKKKRIVKRVKFKTKNKPKKEKEKSEKINLKKIRDNKEILRNIIYRWKKIAQNIKLLDDYKRILISIKKQSKENDTKMKDNNNPKSKQNYEKINEELLNRLKKVNLQLVLSIYGKKQNLLLKEAFNKWKSKINIIKVNKIKKKNRTLVKQISKYIKKKVGSCFKKKNNDNNDIMKNKEKTFAKKKTKLNLYKERFAKINSSFLKHANAINNINNKINDTKLENNNILDNNNDNINNKKMEKYQILDNDNNINNINNIKLENYQLLDNNDNTIINDIKSNNQINKDNNKSNKKSYINKSISNVTQPRYIIKNPGGRNMSQKRIKTNTILDYYNMNEKEKKPHMSKSNEKNYLLYQINDIPIINSNMENVISNTEFSSEYPYNGLSESRDKNSNINISKTISSQEDSHFSLIQESKEVQKPQNTINLNIKNKKSYYSPNKTYKISVPKTKNILTEQRTKECPYCHNNQIDDDNSKNYTYKNNINIKKIQIPYNNNTNSEYKMIERKNDNNNNIYLYSYENDSNANKTYREHINKPQYYNNTTFNKPQYYNNTTFKNNNNNNEVQTHNPLYERMRLTKINSNFKNFYSPLSKKIKEDIINLKNYNLNKRIYIYQESEENNINSYYEKETIDNYNF